MWYNNQQKKKPVQADTQQTDSNTLEQVDSDKVIQKYTRCEVSCMSSSWAWLRVLEKEVATHPHLARAQTT